MRNSLLVLSLVGLWITGCALSQDLGYHNNGTGGVGGKGGTGNQGTPTGSGGAGGAGGDPACMPGCEPGAFQWGRFAGGSLNNIWVDNVAVDSAGNVILAGLFEGTVDFGLETLTSVGDADIVMAKLDPEGNALWSKRFGSTAVEVPNDVAIDLDGNVVITGLFNDTIDFGAGPLTATADDTAFIAKFGPDGSHLWSKSLATTGGAQHVATDKSGNLVIAGNFMDSMDLGGVTLVSAGNTDVFVAKLDEHGALLWGKRFGSAGYEYASDIAVDAAGHFFLAGGFDQTISLGGASLSSAGLGDIFLAKLDSLGGHIWSRRGGDALNQFVKQVAVDGAGDVVVAGNFYGSVDLGGVPLVSAGDIDAFLLKVDSMGNAVWGKRFGDEEFQIAHGASVDASGRVVVVGGMRGHADFGDAIRASAGEQDCFAATFNADGSPVWSGAFGGPSWDVCTATALDGAGGLVLTGHTGGPVVSFGGVPLTTQKPINIFFVKLNAGCDPGCQ